MLKKIKQDLFREKFVFVSFAVTWLSLVLFAFVAGLAPFGDKCLLSMDLHGQYYPMMAEKLSDYFSVWSWNGGLGFAAAVQSAYYTNSVFLLLLLPFSGYARVAALHMMIFLKLALASAAFTYYLGRKFGRYDVFTAVFGIAYGLSAYTLAFMNQPMWLDVVLFCPLVLCAMERLLAGGSPVMYVLVLALAIYSNFYISFALCIFLILWFIASVVMKKWSGFRDLARITLKFGCASVAAGFLCAFMLIPLMLHMENWISSSVGFPNEGEWYHSFAEIADSFCALGKMSLEFGPANVFCGSASVFLILLYAFNLAVPLKKRLVMISLTALMFVSFEWNFLDFIWHGLHFPNQLPGRQSFLFILVALLIGYEAVTRLEGVRFSGLLCSFLASSAFLLVGMGESENAKGRLFTVIMILSIFALLTIVVALKKTPSVSYMMKMGIALVLLIDICGNAFFVLGQHARVTSAAVYVQNEEQMLRYAKKYQSGEEAFWRTEMTRPFTFDCGQLYGFKGLTYYSSTMNGDIYHLMGRLGNRIYARNVSTVYMPTPFQDMMFGVKYHYMNNGRTLSYGKKLEKANGIAVYESPYALPIAYAVDSGIENIERVSKNGLAFQEAFIGFAADMNRRLLYSANILDARVSNGEIRNGYLYVRDPEGPMTYTVEMEVWRDGHFYLEFGFLVGEYSVSVDGGRPRTGACGADPLLDMGYLYAGDSVTVTVTTRGYRQVVYGVRGYILDDAALSEAHKKLSSGSMQVNYASDTEIRGEITLAEDGVLYSSIPAEKGWEVYIDGEKRESYDLGLGLLLCDIEAGTHTVEYRYRAPGLALGIAVSSVTAVLCVAYAVFEIRKKKKTESS